MKVLLNSVLKPLIFVAIGIGIAFAFLPEKPCNHILSDGISGKIDSLNRQIRYWEEVAIRFEDSIHKLEAKNNETLHNITKHKDNGPRITDYNNLDLNSLDSVWTRYNTAN